MLITKIITRTVVAAGVLFSSAAFPHVAQAHQIENYQSEENAVRQVEEKSANGVTISQGDMISNKLSTSCTAGYVGDGFLLTAKHCLGDGENSEFYDTFGNYIGTGVKPDNGIDTGDWAIVKLAPGVHNGGNAYSGDNFTTVSVGDEVCKFGIRTGREKCGKITSESRNGSFRTNIPSDHGDSGGAVYRPHKGGLVGIHSYGCSYEDTVCSGFYPVKEEDLYDISQVKVHPPKAPGLFGATHNTLRDGIKKSGSSDGSSNVGASSIVTLYSPFLFIAEIAKKILSLFVPAQDLGHWLTNM